ncbi:hypothetical protein AYO20_00998 [Fonsecaea nubica]|uniref:SnoaL-like domain-containing protein n=1 Tax=Fonsecaea nubica TaxID=856822 RepID=A0A178DEG7_9EURO|nr:hypothetical protein AYO20_00998 [Fonsecaea nubica]OAL39601.1 hypothetical protein AYO20_00998 [Fonsecaea nubica]
MSYVTKETVWPLAIVLDDKVKALIALFYELADNTGPEAGPRMANEVFTSTGKFVASHAAFSGREEITRCRDNAWGDITARNHRITHVFVNDKQGRDLVLLGVAKMDFASGKVVETDFGAHVVLEDVDGEPRVALMQVYAVSSLPLSLLK